MWGIDETISLNKAAKHGDSALKAGARIQKNKKKAKPSKKGK